ALPSPVPRLAAARLRRRPAPIPAGHRAGERLPGRHRAGPSADGVLSGVPAHPWQGPQPPIPAEQQPARRDQPLKPTSPGAITMWSITSGQRLWGSPGMAPMPGNPSVIWMAAAKGWPARSGHRWVLEGGVVRMVTRGRFRAAVLLALAGLGLS